MSQIWSPFCIIKWEPNPNTPFNFGDGANYPDSTEGPSIVLHATGANVLTVGGSTRFMSSSNVVAEMKHPLFRDYSHGKGLLWWNPMYPDGHGAAE